MDLKNLNTFIQVAESGSFSRAAEILGYTQPTVSIQIKQLEEELGFQLFDRIHHTIRLTDSGRNALSHAQRICHMCQEMTLAPHQEHSLRGEIRLAMADSLCAPLINQIFSPLRKEHPFLSLVLPTAGTNELFQLLNQNEVDLVCTLDSHIYNTNYVIAHEEKVGVHFVVSSRNPLAKEAALSPQDLLSQNFLLTEKGISYRRLLDEWMAESSMEIRPVLEIGHADLICKLVEQDMGISFLPDYITDSAVRKGTVTRLCVQNFQPDLWMQLLYHRNKWVSPAMQAVISHLSQSTLSR